MAEDGGGQGIDLGKFKYASWKAVPESPLRDVLESIATGQPSSLDLDTIIKSVDDLAIVMKTLNEQIVHTRDGTKPGHSVTTIAMRYCPALRREEALPLLCELCTTQWENEPEPGVVQKGPTIVIVENFYLEGSVSAANTGTIEAAWNSMGKRPLWGKPFKEEGWTLQGAMETKMAPFTLRRKPDSYNLGGKGDDIIAGMREMDIRKGGAGMPYGTEHHVDLQVYRAVFGEPAGFSEARLKEEPNGNFLQPKKDLNGHVIHGKNGEPEMAMVVEQADPRSVEAARIKAAGGGGGGGGGKKGGKKKK